MNGIPRNQSTLKGHHHENTMVQHISGGDEVRTRERHTTKAGEATRVGGLRMAGGMVATGAGGLATNMVKQSRRYFVIS